MNESLQEVVQEAQETNRRRTALHTEKRNKDKAVREAQVRKGVCGFGSHDLFFLVVRIKGGVALDHMTFSLYL